MNLTDHPHTLRVTGAELLELGAQQRNGDLRLEGMTVGYSELIGHDKLGRRKTRHVNSGYTVQIIWPQPAAPNPFKVPNGKNNKTALNFL